ncbi:SMR family transporter [Musicola keenii]|uniref:SMR family transporter n=1 Tax=Musicola keenii TaxID=2884250 RepID=UPI001CE33533|nr:SMR family transporter [Musicola keenii]
MTYLFLCLAIVSEVIATTALKLSDSFTRPLPSFITVVFYIVAFYSLTITMRILPTGVIYAIWSGAGIVLITGVSWGIYGQRLDWPAILGMLLIIAGVVVINVFSKSVAH